MSHLPKERMYYESWSSLWKDGYRSQAFHAAQRDAQGKRELPLSERLLFTQSNARVLLGQDACGHLAFLCAPHETDYPLPTDVTEPDYPITACPGMYDQVDVAMWFGDVHYDIELDDGCAVGVDESQWDTWYLDHFLPVTQVKMGALDVRFLSIAPVLETETRASGIPGTPLPGPSGAIYAAVLKNDSERQLSGKCRLRFAKRFVIRSEYNGHDPFEKDCVAPYRCEWERDIYCLWRPDACAAFYLRGGVHEGGEDGDVFVPFSLAPGAETVISCRIAVAPEKGGLSAAMAALLRHEPLEWIGITAGFWRSRLGKLTLSLDAPESLSQQYADFQIRNIIDNFNCLQANAEGRLLVHWQGAPSHNVGRFWGIDIEPTVNSLLYALPELGPVALRYLSRRNEPEFSIYSDHSTPIRVSLMIIAGKYLELTGDVAFFRNEPEIMSALRRTFDRLLKTKHGAHALFSSRYSSDGIVFHRYDVGTNVKVWLALGAYQRVLEAVGEPCGVDLRALRAQLRDDVFRELVEEGPFGAQFTGGKTFGEDRAFYFRDDIFYYDGEDSTSCMMPVYGFCSYDEPAWQNYHRFARSLFCSNYDPEMQALRWFFYGGAVDGTAYVSALGGAVTRGEMREALENMMRCAVDVTGSLYWWPKGVNRRRCIARCSQGQGSWAIQGMEQWLGVRFDSSRGTLVLCPQGLIKSYCVEGLRLGSGCFDIEWQEMDEGVCLRVRNRCNAPVGVRVGIRGKGCGCDGSVQWHDFSLACGEASEHSWSHAEAVPAEGADIEGVELQKMRESGDVFDISGLQFPGAEQQANAFLMRCVWLPDHHCRDAVVRVEVPEGWGIEAKDVGCWPELGAMDERSAEIAWREVPAAARQVAPFFVRMPAGVKAEDVWQGAHPFAYPFMRGERALFAAAKERKEARLIATLTYMDDTGKHAVRRELPVHLLPPREHARIVRNIVHGADW